MSSIKDIALACGVSVATVSKALNGYEDISEHTRIKIKAKAAELSYFANAYARALKTNRTYNLGVLCEDDSNSGLTHPYFSCVLQNFKTEVEQVGYDITFISRNLGGREFSFLEHCHYRKVDGLFIACVNFDTPGVAAIFEAELPVVTIDYVVKGASSVSSNNYEGMSQLVRYIMSLGHSKIACLHGEPTFPTQQRVQAYMDCLSDMRIKVSPDYKIECTYLSSDSTYQATMRLLSLESTRRPTCIIMPDDLSALGGIRAIAECGLSIPDDISIAGYDGILLSQILTPKLTTHHQDAQRVGREAARKLISLVDNPLAEPENAIISGWLLQGQSVKDLNSY